MANTKRTVLITGCSDGGLGAALAISFHNAGLKVYATSRNPSKMKHLESLGIEIFTLDVLSETSIAAAVAKLSSLDILVNNAGTLYNIPVSDISIPKAKELFDLNVWSYIAVTQAFLPLLLKSKGILVNHTSMASVLTVPFQSVYSASKAAMAMFSDTQRLELAPFGIRVVELKTGLVSSNLTTHNREMLPLDTIYAPARDIVEASMHGDKFTDGDMPSDQWANGVVGDILKKSPPSVIWRGGSVWIVRIGSALPHGTLDGTITKMTGLDVVVREVKK